jgi:GntR family transcriptional regulator
VTSRRIALVEQVRNELRELISNGTYRPGDQLPNEQEVGERFDVSRATVREAYRGLIEAGYLTRRQGSGTFVARSPQQHALDLNLSYTEMIRAAGYQPSIVVLSQTVRKADPADAGRLGLTVDDDVIVVERLRLADDRPVVYSVDRVASAIIPENERGTGFGESLFGLLEHLSRGARNGRARLKPVLAEGSVAEHLSVAPGSPLLYFDETDFDAAGLPVLASYEWHTSDVFDMWLNRKAAFIGASTL